MKLLYITNGVNGSGGLERVLSVKASYFSKNRDYEVHIAGLNNGTENLFYNFDKKIKFHSISIGGYPIKYVYQYIIGFRRLVNEIKPDIILVCDDGLKAFFLPLLLGKSRPIIYERHVSKNIELKGNASFIDRIIFKIKAKTMDVLSNTFDAFVVLTNDNVSEWKSTSEIHIISNPLSFYPEKSSTLLEKRVIAVGKQSYQKGFDLLLKSWEKVHSKFPDWQLEIYGKKDENIGLEKLASDLAIKNSINFFSPQKDILNKYLQSSIYVLSSRFEGFGMVLIEAMACGIPCVSFDCPCGPKDIIKDNEDGFLVEAENISQFAEKIILLIEDKEKRLQMGKNAKENVKRYLPQNIIEKWENLFTNLLK